MEISKTSELEITFEDSPGRLQQVAQLLAENGIDGQAFAGWAKEGVGHITFITADNQKARQVLEQAGFKVSERPAVVVIDDNRIGSAAEISRRIAEAGINLTEAYATAAGDRYMTVLRAHDIDALYRALSQD